MQAPINSILVLHESLPTNARADELDTLAQVEQVSAALRELGWKVSGLATGLDLCTTLAEINAFHPSCVFNLVESLAGKGQLIHLLPALLESIKQPFTGCGSDAMYLSSNKLLAKRWMRSNNLPTPGHFLPGEAMPGKNSTWIVKSVWEHASFGMDDACVVNSVAAAQTRMQHCIERHGGDWFAEQFVDGREFNISVVEIDGLPNILPIAEMTFVDYPHGKPKIVGYAAKWDESTIEYHATQRSFKPLPQAEHDTLATLVRNCWNLFALRGYARVDIRMDASGTPWVLEINANPCLSTDGGFAAAANEAGIGYRDLIEHVLHAGIK